MKKKVTFIATVAILSSAFATHASADTHTVQKGDTLLRIAKTYSTNVSDLKTLNKLASDTIYVNQTLTVSKQPTATPPSPNTNKEKAATPTKSTYTIVKGDSLSAIAAKHQLSLSDLKALNQLTSDLIYPGQTLSVAATKPTAPTPAKKTKTTPSTTPIKVEAKVEEAYTIMPGDTLGKIASQFRMTTQQLKDVNKLTTDIIYAGKTLKVSSQARSTEPIEQKPLPMSNDAEKLIREAKSLLGAPYVFGGSDLEGFDCSGLLYYVAKQVGQDLQRLSSEGYYNRSYYVDKPQPGDLVFFENTYKKGISHLGIYLGNNEMIHADDPGVRITNLDDPYYKKHFEGFKRFY